MAGASHRLAMFTTTFLLLAVILLGVNAYEEHENSTKRSPHHNIYTRFPNADAVATGYVLAKGNPIPEGEKIDSGLTSGYVFEPYQMIEDKKEGTMSVLSDGYKATDQHTCTIRYTNDLVNTVKQFKDLIDKSSSSKSSLQVGLELELEGTIGGDIKGAKVEGKAKTKLPPPVKLGFASSKDNRNIKGFFTQDKGVMAVTQASCSLYTLSLNKLAPPKFSGNFLVSLEDLQVMLDRGKDATDPVTEKDIRDILDTYGTHFLTQATMGARMMATTELTHDEYKSNDEHTIKNCQEKNFQVYMGFTAAQEDKKCLNKEKSSRDDSMSAKDRTTVTTFGSKDYKDIHEWSRQTFSHPVILRMELAPIMNIFDKPFFRNVKRANGKKFDIANLWNLVWPVFAKYCPFTDAEEKKKCLSDDISLDAGCGWDDTCDRKTQLCIDDKPNRPAFKCCNKMCNKPEYDPCYGHGTCTDFPSLQEGRTSNCGYECHCTGPWEGMHCNIKVPNKEDVAKLTKAKMEESDLYMTEQYTYAKKISEHIQPNYPDYRFQVMCYGTGNGFGFHTQTSNGRMIMIKHQNTKAKRTCAVGWAPMRYQRLTPPPGKPDPKTFIESMHLDCWAEDIADNIQLALQNYYGLKEVVVQACQPWPCGETDSRWYVKAYPGNTGYNSGMIEKMTCNVKNSRKKGKAFVSWIF